MEPEQYDANYTYLLSEKNGKTILSFEIGDYSKLPKAKDSYDTSLECVETTKEKIIALSEPKTNK